VTAGAILLSDRSVALRALLVMEEVKCGGAELSFFALCRALASRCEVHLAVSRRALDHPVLRASCQALPDAVRIHYSTAPLNAGTLANLNRHLRAAGAGELAGIIATTRPDLILVNLPTVERSSPPRGRRYGAFST
jgi:hypothetical protein